MEYKFKSKWDENTGISWWDESRKELNKIIECYNNWQIEDFNEEKSKKVLVMIEYGKQTIGSTYGGTGYWDELIEMEKFVKSYKTDK